MLNYKTRRTSFETLAHRKCRLRHRGASVMKCPCVWTKRFGHRWGRWDEGAGRMGRPARGNRDNWSWDKELRHVDQHVVRSLRNTNCECQAIITRGKRKLGIRVRVGLMSSMWEKSLPAVVYVLDKIKYS